MIVINHTVKTVFNELIKVLGVFKHHRMRLVNKEIGHLTWKALQDMYLSIDNLVLEMATGITEEGQRGFKAICKHYQENAIPDKYLYTNLISQTFKPRILPKAVKKIKKKRGRPRKN